MISHIQIRERGATPGLTRKVFNAASKSSWFEAGLFDHLEHSQEPFTDEFRQEAGFPARRGQRLPVGSPGFRASYYGRKLRSRFGGGEGKALPNVYTGDSRDRAKFVRTSATRDGVVNRYRVPRLNFKNPQSRVHPVREFRFRLERQINATANVVDTALDKNLASSTEAQTVTVR